MAADVFGTYLILAMGLFTVSSLIIGYFLLNNSVISCGKEALTHLFKNARNAQLINKVRFFNSNQPEFKFKIHYFSAYFTSEYDIYYDIIDGLRMFMYGIPRNDLSMLKDIMNSAQYSFSNEFLIQFRS